jgi:putative ABC transport system permease protein
VISTNIRMAFTSIKASKTRSFLTMLGVVIGVASVVTTVGIADGIRKQVVDQIDQFGSDVITIKPGKTFAYDSSTGAITSFNPSAQQGVSTLSEKDIESLKSIKGVSTVIPSMQIGGVLSTDSKQNYSEARIVGVTGDVQNILGDKVDYGDFFGPNDNERNTVVIGRNIAEDLFTIRDPIGQTITIRGETFVVRGILQPFKESTLTISDNLNNFVFMPYGMAKKISNNSGQINEIFVQVNDIKDVNSINDQIKNTLLANHAGQEDFTILKKEDYLAAANKTMSQLTSFIVAIASTSLIVGGIGIMNIMLVGVSERTKEIGVRKAVGATNQQILSQFLVEATVISVVGGIIGVLSSLLITYFIKIWTDLNPVVSVGTILLASLVSIAVGIIFGMAPAIQAARKDPIQSLRYE